LRQAKGGRPFDVIFERAKTRMVGAVGFESAHQRSFM
jgi:hypothetical protein